MKFGLYLDTKKIQWNKYLHEISLVIVFILKIENWLCRPICNTEVISKLWVMNLYLGIWERKRSVLSFSTRLPVCSVSQDVQGRSLEHLKVPRPSLCWDGSSESQASPWYHIFTFGAPRVFPDHVRARQSRLELGCTSLSSSWLL